MYKIHCVEQNNDLFSSVFKKIIPDTITPIFQEVGGVTQPLIFCLRHTIILDIEITITKLKDFFSRDICLSLF